MLLETKTNIPIDTVLDLLEKQHGGHGLQYVGCEALRLLVKKFNIEITESAKEWLDGLKNIYPIERRS